MNSVISESAAEPLPLHAAASSTITAPAAASTPTSCQLRSPPIPFISPCCARPDQPRHGPAPTPKVGLGLLVQRPVASESRFQPVKRGVVVTPPPPAWSNCAVKPTIRSYRGRGRVPAFVIMANWPLRHGTPGPETRPAATGMSWLDQRRQKSVVVGPFTTNAARGRTSRQAHLAQESQQPRPSAGDP